MTRSTVGALLLAALFAAGGCGKKPSPPHRSVGKSLKPPAFSLAPPARVVAQMWENVRSIELSGTMQSWEPQQSYEPDGPPRDLGSAKFVLRESRDSGQGSIGWSRQVKYPFARSYEYVNVVDSTRGEVRGLDSWYFETAPPPRAMSSDHFAATWRQIHQLSPLSFLTGRAPELQAMLDPVTKLPLRLRAKDVDETAGDSILDVVMGEWMPAGDLLVPRSTSWMLNGATLAEVRIEHVRLNPTDEPPPPPAFLPIASDRKSFVPFEWVLRREAMGGYSDDDSIKKQHLERVANGIELVAGRTHNALIVDMGDHLVVVDAPLDEAYAKWVLATCRERFPLELVTTLVLTHHHNDHSAGARAFVAAGAQVIVGAGNLAHFRKVFEATHLLDNDTLAGAPRPARILEVDEPLLLRGRARSLQLMRIANHHAANMLVAYLPIERIAFVADLWSPGRDKLRAPETFERHRDLVEALRSAKITPKLVVGGHGGVGNYAELATAVDAGPEGPEPSVAQTPPPP
jgi:glyoxylase-like metal-dependent hydrolase (beta-lactamase superfamily II)